MNKTLMRMLTLMLLAILSLGARAKQVTVIYGEKGEMGNPYYKFSGGTIEATKQSTDASGQVTVTLTVPPASGYSIAKKDITVVATRPASGTRAPEIAGPLTLDGKDPQNLSEKRTYTITVDEGLGVWVQKAEFSNSEETKGNRSDYSGTYFIANGNGYNSTNIANNFYLVPATNSNYATDQPHLTTTKSGQVLNCCWQIVKSGDYYRIIHVADGKYLTANPAYNGTSGNDVGRLRVHLEEMATPDDNTLFEIKTNSNGGYNIRYKDMADKINNSTTTYLDPAGGNVDGTNLTNKRTASTSNGTINVGGGIGYWTDEAAARWRFEPVPQNNTYTYNIVDRSGRIAIKYTTGADQPAAKALSSYTDIPEAIRSPYLNGETVSFYSFSGDFSTDKLSAENEITATPVTDGANIYVTYTTDHLGERFVKLRGTGAFNITVNGKCIYDDSGLTAETTDFSSTTTTTNHLWYFMGNDPYAVQIKNLDTGNLLQFDTTGPTLSVATSPTNKYFIIMEGSTSGAGVANGQMELMAATGDATYYRIENGAGLNINNSTSTGDPSLQVRAYPVSITTKYHLIDKAGKLIEGNIESESSELGLPDEWKSPLVSEYYYYSTPNLSGDTYAPSGTVFSPFDVGSGGDIYVTYDVGNDIDLTGGKTYLLKFLYGVDFNQEDGNDGILNTPTPAIYPYNNGDFHLYVYGQNQWDTQLAKGASTRTRWLWYFISSNNGTPLTGANIDPYHVIVKSRQEQLIKAQKDDESEHKFIGHTYLRTYKPDGYASVVTGVSYENEEYHQYYSGTMPTSMVNGEPTEYMILGTSISNMKLKTVNQVEGSRRVVDSFEQYWKNNPTVEGIASSDPDANNADLTAKEWHRYSAWAYAAAWEDPNPKNKALSNANHWFQTISMGTGNNAGKFTVEQVDLAPQVILLDQHGWEIMHAPLSETATLSKYNSPMVANYHWYPTATKTTGYHKYTVSGTPSHESTLLDDTPDGATDFYVTYTVKDDYARNYQGAATEEAVVPSSYLVKQGGSYATYSGSGTAIGTVATKPSRESVTDELLWNLKPNFKIDEEMGFVYGTGDASKSSIESAYYAAGQNGFDPYNVQIQSKAYPLRYFTTNTTGSALNGGAWEGTSSTTVTLQNLGTKYTATGYDQTTLNITNATFMVVSDGNGNMRLMPRFDNSKVMQSFGTLAESTIVGDQGTYLYIELVADAKEIHSSAEITDLNGNYLLAEDFSFASGFTSLGTSTAPFTGTIDGQMNTFEGLTVPLVAYANGAIIRNIIIKGATISSGNTEGDAGAICCKADGATRIYNCGILPTKVERDPENKNKITGFSGSSVSGPSSSPRYVGGIVGFLDGTSRVINCYSYANITGGSVRAGIVGYNNYASNCGTSGSPAVSNIRTMVMNCMFYGNIDYSSGSVYPIYGGQIINNDYHKTNRPNAKLNNYNYFLYEAPFSEGRHIPAANYNCALAAEERFLVRFEFYRHLLNSTRELAAWYATGDAANGRGAGDNNKMAKWVLDKSIAPYPILKEQGTYYSVVNYDPYNTYDATGAKVSRTSVTKRNQGKDLGTTLTITIQNSTSGYGQSAPTGANVETTSLTLPRIDKDTLNYNFNYDKVQLPYYNDVGTGNYTGNRVVTGWKIVSMEGGTSGGYSETNYDAPNYNFADRDTYGKDIYPANTTNKTSGRIFSQGGYFNVPKGVTGITIEPYWGIAAYLSDACYDRYGYNDTDNLTQVGGGQRYTNNTNCPILTGSQKVFTKLSGDDGALAALTGASGTATVYDYALVLVGNYHHHATLGKNGPELSDGDTPFTIMSIDLNEDNEPDYCLIYRSGKNKVICPIRFDFITVPGMAMAHKMVQEGTADDSKDLGIPGNCCPKGWFEITTTGLIKYGQFEHSYNGKTNSPLIFMGGVIDQFCANNTGTSDGFNNKTKYMLFGDNVWFKMLSNGNHMDKSQAMPHRPISITGGEYEKLYLSGYFRPDATACTAGSGDKNAECYIDGGKFGEMAGAGQENIDGNVTWMVDHADIRSFYGGGAKASNTNQITGNISTTIKNSYVDLFCGGPKFGDMASEKTVITSATDCVFGTYFGAGYGGTSIYKYCPEGTTYNKYENKNYNFNSWVNSTYLNSAKNYYRGKYNVVNGVSIGVSSGYEYEFFAGSGGNVGRLYQKYVSFSLAQTNNVSSELIRCTVRGNFYGGGSLGKVAGTATSTLEGCTVNGSVFGAGYSASIPTASIMAAEKLKVDGVETNPNYNVVTGVYEGSNYPATSEYTWVHVDAALSSGNQTLTDNNEDGTHTIKTNQDTEGLGRVTGKVTLNITGNTIVKGNKVSMDNDGFVIKDKTTGEPVIVVDPDFVGGVFGGGDASDAENDTEVNINTPSVNSKEGDYNVLNVFGGGNKAEVYGNTVVNLYNGIINKDVFGGGNKGIVRGSVEVNIRETPATP